MGRLPHTTTGKDTSDASDIARGRNDHDVCRECVSNQYEKGISEFDHAAAGWPVKTTCIDAIKRNAFASWTGLTEKLVQKFLEIEEPTVMANIHARRSGQRSTRPKQTSAEATDEDLILQENEDLEPPS